MFKESSALSDMLKDLSSLLRRQLTNKSLSTHAAPLIILAIFFLLSTTSLVSKKSILTYSW